MTSGRETEWDYSGRKGRDGQKKKISKANERKRILKMGKDEKVNGQGEKEGCHSPTREGRGAYNNALYKFIYLLYLLLYLLLLHLYVVGL